MRDDDKPDILTRFRLRQLRDRVKDLLIPGIPEWVPRAQERTGLTAMHPVLFMVIAGTWALVALTLFLGFYAVLVQTIFRDPPAGQEAVWDWRFSIAQLVAVTTVLGAAIALPITLNRLVLTRRQTEVTEKEYFNSVQRQITDGLNTAVQGLGAVNTVKQLRKSQKSNIAYAKGVDGGPDAKPIMEEFTQPNLEVRIGAIYALERIAQDSDRDHVQIMEILCAYIRQNAPAPETDDWPELEMKEGEGNGPLEADWGQRLKDFKQEQYEAQIRLHLREDIQVALTVIGRRSPKQRRLEAGRGIEIEFPFDRIIPDYDVPKKDCDTKAIEAYRDIINEWKDMLDHYEGYKLDLRNTDLRGADLAKLNLNGARLSNARLQASNLTGAHLQGAHLFNVRLQEADLIGAWLQNAKLGGARLQGAILMSARLQGADLGLAQLQGTTLIDTLLQAAVFESTRLQGAKLKKAKLEGALLWHAQLQSANFEEARLQGADFEGSRLQGAQFMKVHLGERTDFFAVKLGGASVGHVDFTDTPQISEHVQDMFGDASVTLPGGHGPRHESWPPHWPKFDLGGDFNKEWRKWQRDPDNYRPPKPPKPEDTA